MNKLIKKALNRLKQGDTRGAEDLYKKILRDAPDDIDANYLLGALYAERGDLDRALRYSERAASLAPRSPYIQNNLGNIHRLRGDLEQAQVCFERAIEFDPSLAEVYNNLGVLWKRLGDVSRAADYYREAIDRQPIFPQAQFNLGKALWDSGQRDLAVASFERVLELDPQHAQALDALGTYYLESGDADRAREFLNRCLALVPQDPFGIRLKLAYLNGDVPPASVPAEWVRQTYETKAHTWDADAARADHEFLGPKHVGEAFARLFNGQDVLNIIDLGCGTGACGSFLRPHAKRLTGVDLSDAMLAVARTKNLYDELALADAISFLNSSTEIANVIVASGVVIFFGDLSQLFAAVMRALKPGGVFIFSAYQSDSGDYAVRANFHFAHSEDYLRRSAERAGLQVQQITPAVHELDHGKPQPGYLVELRKP